MPDVCRAFRREFFTPIQRHQDVEATERLMKLAGPFLLRRMKTDPTVIRDLPAKIPAYTMVPHEYRVIPGGGHDFKVWKSDLYHFAQLVFREPEKKKGTDK